MFTAYFGVDFSGARQAGKNLWLARLEPLGGRKRPPLRLVELASLERLAGTAERGPVLAHLVERIAASDGALWAIDFPFGLPIEVIDEGPRWADQFALLDAWGEDAYGMGLECLRRAKLLGGANHIRRLTDSEALAPFDCYHYRIIYQTHFGMRAVLGPLRSVRRTAILPFHYRRLPTARRVLVEACPASTLKRLGLPHNNYKQAEGGPLTYRRRRTRRRILDGLAAHVAIDPGQRLTLMQNPGGDALDAVIAAVGGARAYATADHFAIARHPRYPREGHLFV